MMERETNIDEVLNSLDHLSRAKASPFLEDRIIHRLHANEGSRSVNREKWIWALSATCAVLLLINGSILWQQSQSDSMESNEMAGVSNTFYLYE